MQKLVAGNELAFIGISLTDINGTWKEEISHRCGNFPDDYKKMLTTIKSHKLLKLNYKVGKLKIKEVNENEIKSFITSSDDEEELGETLISTVPGYWSNEQNEYIEYNYFKKHMDNVLGANINYLENIVNKVLTK